jgi:hypothetical protein
MRSREDKLKKFRERQDRIMAGVPTDIMSPTADAGIEPFFNKNGKIRLRDPLTGKKTNLKNLRKRILRNPYGITAATALDPSTPTLPQLGQNEMIANIFSMFGGQA